VNARELALELIELDSRTRERLLGDLPDDRREQMRELIREAQFLAREPTALFETHLRAEEKAEPFDHALANLNDGQLRVLLNSETPSVQQRIIGALRSGEIDTFPSSIRRVTLDWLVSRQHLSGIAAPDRRNGKPSSQRWAFWRKQA
jgi:hypothetical protein